MTRTNSPHQRKQKTRKKERKRKEKKRKMKEKKMKKKEISFVALTVKQELYFIEKMANLSNKCAIKQTFFF